MSVVVGTRLGPYEIIEAIGKGGMGEVYRARDTRLDRTVAIKVLSGEFSADPERRKRLEREARAISRVTHPHICTLFDVGHQDGIDYLVLECLDGETLQAALLRGPLSMDRVLRYGREIAEALAKAHRMGIVHRDLKPGNIMLTPTGAKLLDFGLATLTQTPFQPAGHDAEALDTQSAPLTQPGTIHGTWRYLAPEVLQGNEADARSDLFALGATLFEMAIGRPAFAGDSAATVVAAVMHVQTPDVSTLRKESPPSLDWLVKRCLEKDPEERWQSAQDAAAELSRAAEPPASNLQVPGLQGRAAARSYQLPIFISALAACLALLLLAAVVLHGRTSAASLPLLRLSVAAPEKQTFEQIVLSPDGSTLAFTATGPDRKQRLWVRRLDTETPQLLAGTEDASGPFWSPDGHSIAFFASDTLKRVDKSGGAPEAMCQAPNAISGSWGAGGSILIAYNLYEPVRQMVVGDCSLRAVTTFHPRADVANSQPFFLPDGRHFLWVKNYFAPQKGIDIYVNSIDSSDSRLVLHNASMPSYIPGYLVFAREGKLMAQAFDEKSLTTRDQLFSIVPERVQSQHFDGTALYSVATNKVLMYAPEIEPTSQLEWRDRSGKPLQQLTEPGFQGLVSLSPDNTRVLMSRRSPETQTGYLWICDLEHGTSGHPGWTRFTNSPLPTSEGRWSMDGTQVYYFDRGTGVLQIRRRSADGSGNDEVMAESSHWLSPRSLSPDGNSLLYETIDAETKADLWVLPLRGDRKPTPFLRTSFDEGNASFSPDGRWVAYVSNKSGKFELYVRPFQGPGPDQQVSAGTSAQVYGGSSLAAHWRRDGKELFYLSDDWKVMAVPITLSPEFHAGTPSALFNLTRGSQVDVSADGQRFLVNARLQSTDATQLNAIVNWTPRPNPD